VQKKDKLTSAMVSCQNCAPAELSDPNRLQLLSSSGLLEGKHERLDRLTALAREILAGPIVMVSMVDVDRQVFASRSGFPDALASLSSTPLSHSFCQHVVTSGRPLVVEDATKDPRVRTNLAIEDLGVVAYAGYPVVSQGQVLGSFCAFLPTPHLWNELQLRVLSEFSAAVSDQIDLRLEVKRLGQSRDRLEKSNLELEQFADILSHDLKAPLRGVRGSLQLLELEMAPLPEHLAEFLSHAVSSAVRMTELIDGLSSYSQAFAKRVPPGLVDLDQLLIEVKQDLQAEITSRGGMILREEPLGQIVGYPVLLRQLFQNLLCNGLKFQPPGQRPTITVGRHPTGVFYVRDNGIGLEPKHHKSVFEIYRSAHSRELYGGSGMGLAICARAVAEHQGEIWVESELGKGCTFLFKLDSQLADPPGLTDES
jgi:signal transduction histidine kinase